MADKRLALISLISCIVGFTLSVATIYADNWVNFEWGEVDLATGTLETTHVEFGLIRQTDDSIGDNVIVTWYCQKAYFCAAYDAYDGLELLENTAEAWCE